MIEKYKYALIFLCDDLNHICQLYSKISEISDELKVHRTTISKKLSDSNKCEIIKNHEKYYIIKI